MLTSDIAVDLISHCMRLVMVMVAVLVVPGMIVGLLVGLFQAATQINEQTLSFLPRLMMTLLAIALAGHWLAGLLMDFCVQVFRQAPTLVG
ncbi:MAG TPA: flagellar biosynthesis protein FliQ [Povalibacter sp.]|uniref:flagellar biosynthesis protein FliQ n=1 Tax=Povalibacter sp. TaxID=1962978 RepID=UPI002C99B648|nr:flagellar biosynthesis protein FliQ [Povalibacter sp.]HMN43161.1 flagellar biosynthesis protein FliQ [Povalibacter sp.]